MRESWRAGTAGLCVPLADSLATYPCQLLALVPRVAAACCIDGKIHEDGLVGPLRARLTRTKLAIDRNRTEDALVTETRNRALAPCDGPGSGSNRLVGAGMDRSRWQMHISCLRSCLSCCSRHISRVRCRWVEPALWIMRRLVALPRLHSRATRAKRGQIATFE